MEKIAQMWLRIQTVLFPFLEEGLGPLSEAEQKLAAVLELVRIEEYVPVRWWHLGRPPADRCALARSFVAKMVYGLSETSDLIERLKSSSGLRRQCGWEWAGEVPSEATFSRSFAEFAGSGLASRAHAALIAEYEGDRLVGHLSRDSTDIVAREKAAVKPKPAASKPARKKGRPRKGEVREAVPAAPGRLERQGEMSLEEMLLDLPRACDWGVKRKHGKSYYWKGYKLHVDWADGEIPISCVLTSASLHDSQAAIPLATLSASRVQSLYDLMDAAYDAAAITAHSLSLGHVPIIDPNPRRKGAEEMAPARKRRFDERSTAERGNSLLKECYGGRTVRVRGFAKVLSHLMFGMVALTADRLLSLVT